MVEKRYEWTDGAVLGEHSKRKHKILREYFAQYLTVRCQLPQQTRFRLAIVDGFAGGGRYKCGAPGSPLVFIEELNRAIAAVNILRAANGFGSVEIECLLVFNDFSEDAIELLKTNVAPLLHEAAETSRHLHLHVEYLSLPFEQAYPKAKALLEAGRYRNVIFNLDQCGHSHVERRTLIDIMSASRSTEIFYTFMITSLLSFLQKDDPALLTNQLRHLDVSPDNLSSLEGAMSKESWLGAAERIVFETFKGCAPFVSPFSINNPGGWRYWLIHFAKNYRARQVYNNVLHDNSSSQAHFGRSGLNMLSYDLADDAGQLYLFDVSGRQSALEQLHDDIPRLLSETGDALEVGDFYETIYTATPAHTDDIHKAIIDNPDVEVVTPSGGERRKANTIVPADILRLKRQISFFPRFVTPNKLS